MILRPFSVRGADLINAPKVDHSVQEALSKLEVDRTGVVSVSALQGSKLKTDALRLLPEARSVVVLEMQVYREVLCHSRPERVTGQTSLSDLLERHMEYLGGRLTAAAYNVAKASHKYGFKALPLPSVGCPIDSRFQVAAFSYKHAAEAAGLGYIGRSSLLITPDYGPRVRLACCLTEAVLDPTPGAAVSVCQGCDVCVENCPSGALGIPRADEPYSINKFACAAFRKGSGGCSECMRLCPARP
jgi:epoxyqueuosine reductase